MIAKETPTMIKLTGRDELSAAIAEKVMGWTPEEKMGAILYRDQGKLNRRCSKRQFGTLERFEPATDLNHSFQALETWHGNKREHETRIDLQYKVYTVDTYNSENRWDDPAIADHESLAVAICLALLQAATGEEVEYNEQDSEVAE